MNALEQLALGLHCTRRALRAAGDARLWWAVAPLLAWQLLALGAFTFGTHPALSWAMAPLLTALAGDAALRYPQFFHRLPALAASATFAGGIVFGPPSAGAATRVLDDLFHGVRPRVGAAVAAAWRRAPALILAALPVVAAEWGLDVALAGSAGVRLSGLTRAALPGAFALALLAVRAAFAWVIAEIMLDGVGPLRALAALPGAFPRGFLAAFAILALLALPLAPFGALEGLVAGGAWPDRPELALVFVVAHAAVQAGVTLAGAGALALAWRGVVAAPAEDAA